MTAGYLDVRKLLALREVVARGTIAAAADALRVSPSAISQQLSSLEGAAGVPLLVRSTRGVRPTPAGQRLVERAHAIVAELELADADLAMNGGVAGTVAIAAFATAMKGIVAPALTPLREQHPRLTPLVRELEPAESLPALASGEIDVALVFGHDLLDRPAHGGCEFEHLLDDPMLLALPAHEFERDAGVPISALADRAWITAWPGSPCYEVTVGACHRAGFQPRVDASSHDFAVVLALVAAGMGVALVPVLALGAVPYGVHIVAPEGEQVLRRIHAAYRRGGRRRPSVDATVTALVAASRGAVRDEAHLHIA